MSDKSFRRLLELIGDKKYGFMREIRPDLPKDDDDPFMPPPLIRKFNLRDGVVVEGSLKPGRKGGMQVGWIDTVMGIPPQEWAQLKEFDSGSIIYPEEKLNLITGPDDISMRVIDLAAPLGKGQRALIVSPPRAGKTVMLKDMAAGISQNHPEVELVALLVDERPEEVTDFRRTTDAMVFASSNDRGEDNHVRVSTLALEYSKRLVEMGKDVVMLLDSLTRLGRTFNLFVNGSGETGSRMDDVIFEEFKGTGNAEIVLDREMADKRIYPAVNLRESGTRNEERLIGDSLPKHHQLFRALNSRPPIEAMQALLKHLRTSPTNAHLLNELVPE